MTFFKNPRNRLGLLIIVGLIFFLTGAHGLIASITLMKLYSYYMKQ